LAAWQADQRGAVSPEVVGQFSSVRSIEPGHARDAGIQHARAATR
jgi:hypothetical protein